MKKKLLLLFTLLLCFAVLLCACGGDEPTEDTTEETEEEWADTWPDLAPEELCNDLLTGEWLHVDGEIELTFDGEKNFWYTDASDGSSMEGRYQFDGLSLYLKDRDGNVYTGYTDEAGDVCLDHLDGYFTSMGYKPELDQSLVGTWTYNLGDIEFTFGPEGEFTCDCLWDHYAGTYTFDGTVLDIFNEIGPMGSGYLEDDQRLFFDDMEGWFYAEGGISYVPLSIEDELKLEPNRAADKTRNPLVNTAALSNPDTGYYERFTADWLAVQNPPKDVGEDKKEIAFVASCFVPYANTPDFSGTVQLHTGYMLYDKYTGLLLNPRDSYLNEDGVYQFEFDSRDGRVVLVYDLDEEKAGAVGDCIEILSIVVTAHMPQWYDGLTIAAVPLPETYESYLETIGGPKRPTAVLAQSNPQLNAGFRFAIQ